MWCREHDLILFKLYIRLNLSIYRHVSSNLRFYNNLFVEICE